jgi:hypothetical protein
VKVFGCRPLTGRATQSGGRRTKTFTGADVEHCRLGFNQQPANPHEIGCDRCGMNDRFEGT